MTYIEYVFLFWMAALTVGVLISLLRGPSNEEIQRLDRRIDDIHCTLHGNLFASIQVEDGMVNKVRRLWYMHYPPKPPSSPEGHPPVAARKGGRKKK